MNEVELFIPGRIEILGNHTDHQNGKVICSPITLGNKVKADANNTDFIVIESANYGITKINIKTLQLIENNMPNNSKKMVVGILKELLERKYCIDGATIKIESTLPVGIGLGSSAAFCLSIVCSLDSLFDYKIDKLEKAKLCQSVENKYIGKESGLMDQIACLSDGPIRIDFKDSNNPLVKNLDLNLEIPGYKICIVDTNSKHDNSIKEYNEIKDEMKLIASYFKKSSLREIDKITFLKKINDLRKETSDIAISRSYHYFEENNRVDLFEEELNNSSVNFNYLLNLINESTNSSKTFLQNYYSTYNKDRSLIIIDIILRELVKKDYASKICGGGFGGSCILIIDTTKINMIKKYFGNNIIFLNLYKNIKDSYI